MILWHLCSLDAPTVAALWTAFIAHSSGISLPVMAPVAMALAVWILYAADRLLDARLLNTLPLTPLTEHTDELEARHLFHHRHRTLFLGGIVLCSLALAPLLLRIPPAALRLYLVEGALLVAWFLLIHATRSSLRLPKELGVGVFFAAAVFIPTVARGPQLRLELLPPALLFAALCSLNCLFIYAWEHEQSVAPDRAHPTTRLALSHLTWLSAALILTSATLAVWQRAAGMLWTLPTACALSLGMLLLLHANRSHIHRTSLRAAADLALLTPLLLLGTARW
ncbi:hypothetical protein FTO74_01650 [Granulicella sp. WH15]|nr:hypothetical protein FTO74_01650 [Granulicella sp. WH15]